MPIFFIGILLIFLDLSVRGKSFVYLTSFLVYSYFLLVFYGILFISDFNNDIPVTFFGFLSYYVILTRFNKPFDTQTVFLTAFFAVASANTKLVGLYSVGLSGIWILYYLYNHRRSLSKKELVNLLSILGVIYIVGLFWYLVFPFLMTAGVGNSPYKQSAGLLDSLLSGLHLIFVSFGNLFSILIFISLVSGIFTEAKHIIIFVIAPLFFIWAFWYNYDCRNLSLILPFTAYAASNGLVHIVKLFNNKINLLKHSYFRQVINSGLRLKYKSLYSILFIFLLLTFLLIVNTKFIFNLGLDTAYFLRSFYFNYTTLVFTSELGYYRYIEYFVDTTSVFIIFFIIAYAIRNSRIKVNHIALLFLLPLLC